MNDKELSEYGVGSGWNAHITRVTGSGVDEHAQFQSVLNAATAATIGGVPTLLFLRCEKGFGGPAVVSGRRMFGTPSMHKTPLMQCRSDAGQRALLDEWLASYRPAELFDHNWQPAGRLAEALRVLSERPKRPTPPTPAVTPTSTQRHDGFAGAVSSAVRHHAKGGDFRVFSPDELTSNRLGDLVGEPWVHEVLAEEVLLGWLAGWVNTGGRGVLVSYEAFAPLLTTGLIAHLKHRRLAAQTELWPSLNILLTSYGWHNTYTHGDPSLVTSLLAAGDPAVRVFTPADPARLASTLDEAFGSYDQVNVIVAGKHSTAPFPPETVHEELSRGLAIWPRLSDNAEPDLTVVTIGDLPAGIAAEAVPLIRTHHGRNVRVVHVQDMTVLGERSSWPHGLTDSEFAHYFGAHAALLIVTLGHPAAVWGLLAGRSSRPVQVIGWREPPGPLPQHKLAADAGLDADGLCRAAARLLDRQAVSS
jgi:xylulose-5-phosphate/fructose-6-phosphate phosphoketolase